MKTNAFSFNRALTRARVLASAGRREECESECAAALEQFEKAPSPCSAQLSEAAGLYCLLAWAEENRGDLAGARRDLKRAVRLSPARYEAWTALSRVCHGLYQTTGEWVLADESEAALRNARFIDSASPPGPSGVGAAGMRRLTG